MDKNTVLDKYETFLKDLDVQLGEYFKNQAEFVSCKKGCSYCCQKGDYPISELELQYLMKGYISLNNETKLLIQKNIKNIQKGEQCPFLINNYCSLYTYRPIICRVHGLAYKLHNASVKLPYCVNQGLNYSKFYNGGFLHTHPINENLDSNVLLKDFEYGEIRNLYDWLEK